MARFNVGGAHSSREKPYINHCYPNKRRVIVSLKQFVSIFDIEPFHQIKANYIGLLTHLEIILKKCHYLGRPLATPLLLQSVVLVLPDKLELEVTHYPGLQRDVPCPASCLAAYEQGSMPT